ncbi:MAG: DNA translocase FtsK [Bacteroidales bacterium]|nr:DNA translocase FtsK [Bacteroidales bacterium]
MLKKKFSFFKDEKFQLIFGLFIFLFSMIALIAFISYFFTWEKDSNIVQKDFFKVLFSNIRSKNSIGLFGAFLSNIFIHKTFGIGSFGFIFLGFLFSIQIFTKKIPNLVKVFFLTLIAIFWTSIVASIFDNDYQIFGGAYGYFILNWLENSIGKFGAYSLLFFSLLIILVYLLPNSIPKCKKFLSKIFNRKHIEPKSEINKSENNNSKINNIDDLDDLDDLINQNKSLRTENSDIEIEITKNQYYNEDEPKNIEKNEAIIKDEIDFEVGEFDSEKIIDEDDFNNQQLEDYDPTKDLEYYKLPPIDILNDYPTNRGNISEAEFNAELKANSDKIVKTLNDYKIEISKIKATVGPAVTLYEIIPAPGVKISKIKSLEDDIALSLAALGIRIEAPIPGKGTIGIEVPNSKPDVVSMRSVLKSEKFQNSKYELPVAMGKTISNETYVFNLAKTPHLLVAGATGQGKSVGINVIITSLLYKKHPSQLKFVLIDPKMVELSLYNKIEKNFLAKLPNEESAIITDVTKVVPVMNSLCILMDERYRLLTLASVRNIIEYNEKFIKRKLNPNNGHYFMPYIVVVIDEFADIIVQEGKQIEAPISRIAAKARAIGIHLIVATQRPSTDVITGVIKANFPTRVAFKVTNIHDSKTILDHTGANQLIGKGDMLISENGQIVRLQSAFVDTPEVENLVDFISKQQSYSYAMPLPEPSTSDNEYGSSGNNLNSNEKDELFVEAARLIVRHQQGSTSLIQRKMSLGYNRAGRIIDQLEAAGIVGPYEGSKARQVNFPDEYSLDQYLNTLNL